MGAIMTRSEFLSAARKGQGRAISSLRDGEFTPSFHDLRRLILRWPGIDARCEAGRGWYSAELIKGSEFEEQLKNLVVRHLARVKGDRRHQNHRIAVVHELAKRGHLAAKEAFYAQYDPSDEFRFSDEIIDVDGLAGLDWLITHSEGFVLPEVSLRFRGWIKDLEEACGKEMIASWLASESSPRPEIAEFRRLLDFRPEPKEKGDKPPVATIPFETLRDQWLGHVEGRMWVRPWVRTASDEDIKKAWVALENDVDPQWLNHLAIELSGKPEHCNIERMVQRAQTWTGEFNPFAMALDRCSDPRVRQLGFDLMNSGSIRDGIDLLVRHAQSGDEPMILAAVSKITENNELQSASLAILRFGDNLETRNLLIWVCENSSCSMCRASAVYELIKKGTLPESVRQECRLDCTPAIRKLTEMELD